MKYWLLALSVVLLAPNLFYIHLVELPERPIRQEDFNTDLAKKIRSLESLENFIDSTMKVRSGLQQSKTELYANVISSTIRSRFYHSYSHYSLNENWMAAAAGKVIWYDLSAIVIADDILQYPMAACSQQAIVLMEYLKLKKIPFRRIAFDHHFAVEGYINNQWIYFDPNLEPEFYGTHRDFEYLRVGDRLNDLYKDVLPVNKIDGLLANPRYGKVNAYPAPKARILHYVFSTLSHGLWLFPLFLFGMNLRDKKWNKTSLLSAKSPFISEE